MDEKIVTRLVVQKKDTQRINVFLDEEFAFGISLMAGRDLRIGQKLSQADIDRMLSEDEDEVIRRKALELLGLRPMSESELNVKLQQKGFDPERIMNVIDGLKAIDRINDQRFSSLWVENRQSLHPRSRRMICYELRQKGVAEEIIHDSVQDIEDDQTAFDLAVRYSKRLVNMDWQAFRKRLGGYLARKGYGYETVDSVTRRIWSEINESDTNR